MALVRCVDDGVVEVTVMVTSSGVYSATSYARRLQISREAARSLEPSWVSIRELGLSGADQALAIGSTSM